MSRLSIDFAPRKTLVLMYRLPFWVWPLMLLGLLSVSGAGMRLWTLQHKIAVVHQSLASAQQRMEQRAGKPRPAATMSITPDLANAVNSAVRQLNTPWSDLFDAMEGAASLKVALLEIRPDTSGHRVFGVAEARSSEEMISYIERLKAQPLFSAAVITNHQINDQNRNKPWRFDFTVTWREF
jgi:Tfp pilus assembly protein PilN